jgi:ketosteroid isomerase-like protein
MYKTIVTAKLRKLFAGANEGNWQPIVDGFASDFSYRFLGDSPLGGTRTTHKAMALWWTRLFRLFPGAQFEPKVIVVSGPPWNTVVMTHIFFRATIPSENRTEQEMYENEFMQRLHLRWGKITSVVTIEDTQRFINVLPRLAASGVADATANEITD